MALKRSCWNHDHDTVMAYVGGVWRRRAYARDSWSFGSYVSAETEGRLPLLTPNRFHLDHCPFDLPVMKIRANLVAGFQFVLCLFFDTAKVSARIGETRSGPDMVPLPRAGLRLNPVILDTVISDS